MPMTGPGRHSNCSRQQISIGSTMKIVLVIDAGQSARVVPDAGVDTGKKTQER